MLCQAAKHNLLFWLLLLKIPGDTIHFSLKGFAPAIKFQLPFIQSVSPFLSNFFPSRRPYPQNLSLCCKLNHLFSGLRTFLLLRKQNSQLSPRYLGLQLPHFFAIGPKLIMLRSKIFEGPRMCYYIWEETIAVLLLNPCLKCWKQAGKSV